MKKFILSLLSVSALCGYNSLFAENENSIEFRSSAFFHSEKRFRDIYGSVGPAFGIEASSHFCGEYGAWINVDYSLEKSHEDCCKTTLGILNTSFGLKYIYPLTCHFDLYAGIGPAFSWVDLKNHTCCENDHFSRLAVGGVVKTGVYYQFCTNYFIDIFADYLFQPVHIGRSIDIGGLKLGLGIGTQF